MTASPTRAASRDALLTADEETLLAETATQIDDLDAQIAALQAQRKDALDLRSLVTKEAGARATTPEEIADAYRLLGARYDDLCAIVRGMHPCMHSLVERFGVQGNLVLAAGLSFYSDPPTYDDPSALSAGIAEALCAAARLLAPDGGVTLELDERGQTSDWQWFSHANGMHPVTISGDRNESRHLLLAHSMDGTEAVLLDQRGWEWRDADGVAARGTLSEVIQFLLRALEIAAERDDYCDHCWGGCSC